MLCTFSFSSPSLIRWRITLPFLVPPCLHAVDDPCDAVPCANGGTCNWTGLTDFSCACDGNWSGATCRNELELFHIKNCVCYNSIDAHTCAILPIVCFISAVFVGMFMSFQSLLSPASIKYIQVFYISVLHTQNVTLMNSIFPIPV